MAHPKETREKVRRLYVFDGQPLEMAAVMASVAIGTARRWKDADKQMGDDWDKVRAAHTIAGGGLEELSRSILTGFLVQYQATMEKINADEELPAMAKVEMLTSLADAFTKTTAASRKVLPETSQLATAIEVLNMFGEFVQQKYPKHLQAFVEMLEPFGAEIEKRFS